MTEAKSSLLITINAEYAKKTANDLNRELRAIESNGDAASKAMDSMASAARTVATQFLAIGSAGALIAKMDVYTQINNKLKIVTTSQIELNRALDDTFKIAQRSASSWIAVNDVYAKYMSNAKTLNITQAEVAKLTEITAKAVALSGSNAESASAALFQYGQSLDGNILRAEEFNSLVDGAGGLLNAMAKGLNATRGELRQMMLDGKLTGDVITKALLNAGNSVDELYKKTDITVKQSLVLLNDSITKFVGETDKANGSSRVLSEGLRLLAENLDTVAGIAMTAGAYWLGSYIPAIYKTIAAGYAKSKQLVEQTAIQYSAIQAEKLAATQELASTAARVAATETTLIALQTERALEIQRLKSQISAQGLAASQTRLAGISQVEAQVKKELIVLTEAQTAAQQRLNTAQNMSLGVGRSLMGVLGGPVGLGLTVATVAGSYLLLKGNTESTTSSLNIQGEAVDELRKKYEALSIAQQKTTLVQIKKEVDELKTSFTVASSNLSAFVEALPISDEKINTVRKLYNEYAQGKITSDQFNISVEKFNFLTDDQKLKINSLSGAYDQSKSKMIQAKAAQDALTNQAPNVVKATDAKTEAEKRYAKALQESKAAYDKYKSSAIDDIKELSARAVLIKNGLTDNQIEQYMKVLKALNYDPVKTKTPYAKQMFELAGLSANLQTTEEQITKQKEAQFKLQLMSNKQLENGYKVYQAFLKAGLSSNQSLAIAAQVGREGDFKNSNLFGSHTDNNNGASNVGMLSWQGSRAKELLKDLRSRDLLNVDGSIKQTQEAIDVMAKFAVQEIMTKKEYVKTRKAVMSGVEDYSQLSEVFGKNFVRWDFDGKKINANKHKQKESNYYQQLSSLVGMSPDGNSIKLDDYGADLEKLNQLKLQYDEKYYTDIKKRQVEHDKEISDYKLLYSGDELKAKIDQSNKQFEAENNLAKLQFEYQVNGWQWVGEERIKKEAEISKAVIDATIELNETQKAAKKKSIDEEAQYAIDVYNASIDQQLVSARSAYMGETELAVRRYQAELREIEKVRDAKIRAGLLDANKMGQFQAQNQASDNVFQVGFQASQDLYQRNSPQQYAQWDLQNQYSSESGNLESKYRDQMNGIDLIANQEERNSQLLAAHQQHLEAMAALDASYAKKEDDLRKAQMDVQLQSAQSIFGSLTDIAKNTAGENSGVYKAMFAMEKGMAIARSIMAIQTAIAEASANPFPYNLAAMATVASQTASIIATIKGVTMPAFATGGVFTGDGYVRGSGTDTSDSINARLSNNEYVIKAKSVRSLGVDTLDYINRMGELPVKRASGGSVGDTSSYIVDRYSGIGNQSTSSQPTINVYTLPGETADVTQNSDGSLDVKIRKIIDEHVPSAMSNPSSRISKSMTQNYAIKRQR
ncbi:tape measure protein [Acinetobacter soli]|uniref:tape measure protein n=1 Tax=Acinetobacter soli TaxID=487316 RepID=UPI00124FF38A|nr:tape measure protein [Acinetobacter soli]